MPPDAASPARRSGYRYPVAAQRTPGTSGDQTMPPPPASGVGRAARVRQLVVVFSPAPPSRGLVVLGTAPVTIGREAEPGIDLVLPDPQISRRHARFTYDAAADRHVIEDAGSRNG